MGNPLGEWSSSYGSVAKQKKIFVGKATNYFSKIKIAEFIIQAHELKLGNEIIIIGKKTGLIQSKITSLRSDKNIKLAKKGQRVSFPLDEKIRKNDQLYIVVNQK